MQEMKAVQTGGRKKKGKKSSLDEYFALKACRPVCVFWTHFWLKCEHCKENWNERKTENSPCQCQYERRTIHINTYFVAQAQKKRRALTRSPWRLASHQHPSPHSICSHGPATPWQRGKAFTLYVSRGVKWVSGQTCTRTPLVQGRLEVRWVNSTLGHRRTNGQARLTKLPEPFWRKPIFMTEKSCYVWLRGGREYIWNAKDG